MKTTKKCPQCGVEKPLIPEFWRRNRTTTSGFHSWCKDCCKRDYVPTGRPAGRQTIPAQAGMRVCPRCKVEKPLTKEFWYTNKNLSHGFQCWCKDCNSDTMLEVNQRRKIAVLNHYGGKCSCCGESEPTFLAIDHINGDGAEHRRKFKTVIYLWLVKNKFPEGFRILCHNCNWAFHALGYCPHHPPIS